MQNLIPVQMTEEDAELFVQFRKYQKEFQILLESGVFEPIVGHVQIVHKDDSGIRKIETITTIIRRV